MEDASQVIGKMERAVTLFTAIAQGRLDPASISDEVDAVVGLLGRLDDEKRWEEALRFARSLAMLLALLGRWVELLRSLRVALSAAEQLADAAGKAWALHEQGTLHLAVEKHAEADDLLTQAHDLRERTGDQRGLATTNRNLQVLCRALRAQLHSPESVLKWILRRPVPALVFAGLLLMVGGAAGAVIRGSGNADPTPNGLVVGIALTPISPHAEEPVVFHATFAGGAHPVRYAWRFDDGDHASTANPTHVYRHPGTYTVTVKVSGMHDTATGEGAETVVVHPKLSLPRPHATFSFRPSSPSVEERVSFNATSSSDPDPNAAITSYTWKFGDGQTATGPTPTHAYARPGTYTTELVVLDTRGASEDTTRIIAVREANTTTTSSAPAITSAKSTTFVAGTEGSFTVIARGAPSPKITETDTLPRGVTFNDGVLSGAPTTTGSFPISFTATNSVGSTVQNFTLMVNSKPAITSASTTTLTYKQMGSFTVTATGSPPPTITEAGTLPRGVTFNDRVLSGTPTQTGTYPITFTAANSVGSDPIQSFTLTIER